MRRTIYAVSTIVGGTIGAGILAIPYVFYNSGFAAGLLNVAFVFVLLLALNLALGEVILRTKGRHQLTGYAEKYLGKCGKYLMSLSMIAGIYGALIAYIIGEGELFASIFGGQPIFYSTVFFIFASSFVYFGIKRVSSSGIIFQAFQAGLFLVLCAILASSFSIERIIGQNSDYFLPFGAVLFAMLAMPAIPEAREVIAKEAGKLKKAILIGTLIPAVIYIVFALLVVGSSSRVSEIATIGLHDLGFVPFLIGNFFAIFIMTTAFLVLGLALQEMYEYDYGFSRINAFLLSCVLPFAAFLLGVRDFIKTISLAGILSALLGAIVISLMFYSAKKKSERKPEYEIKIPKMVFALIIALFAAGIVLQLRTIL